MSTSDGAGVSVAVDVTVAMAVDATAAGGDANVRNACTKSATRACIDRDDAESGAGCTGVCVNAMEACGAACRGVAGTDVVMPCFSVGMNDVVLLCRAADWMERRRSDGRGRRDSGFDADVDVADVMDVLLIFDTPMGNDILFFSSFTILLDVMLRRARSAFWTCASSLSSCDAGVGVHVIDTGMTGFCGEMHSCVGSRRRMALTGCDADMAVMMWGYSLVSSAVTRGEKVEARREHDLGQRTHILWTNNTT